MDKTYSQFVAEKLNELFVNERFKFSLENNNVIEFMYNDKKILCITIKKFY